MLQGKSVLVTRPAHLADNLLDTIKSSGGNPVLLPTVDIQHTVNPEELGPVFRKEEFYDLAIFSSKNAIEAVSNWIIESNLKWPQGLACATVGVETAEFARKILEIEKVVHPKVKYGAEQLLKMAELRNASDKNIVVFDGENSSGVLQEQLSRSCRRLSVFIVYRRIKPNIDVGHVVDYLENNELDYIVATSVSGAANLIDLFEQETKAKLKSTCFVAYSSRIGNYLKEQGVKKILVAERASDEAVLDAIKFDLNG